MYTTDDMDKTRRILFGLRSTRKQIEEGWCRDNYAQYKSLTGCSPHDEYAKRWSLVGAIHKIAADKIYMHDEITECLRGVLRDHNGWDESLTKWNRLETTTKNDVLELIDMAIIDQQIIMNIGDSMLEALLKTRRLIQRGWAHGGGTRTRALNKDGGTCAATYKNAVSWSLVGAVDRATCKRGDHSIQFAKVCSRLQEILKGHGLTQDLSKWNDLRETTKENVIWLLNYAINTEAKKLEFVWRDTCTTRASMPVVFPTVDDIANAKRRDCLVGTAFYGPPPPTRAQCDEQMKPNCGWNLLVMMRDYIENNTLDDTHPLTTLLRREADQSLTGFMHLVVGGQYLEWHVQDEVWHRIIHCNGQAAVQRVFHTPKMRIIQDLKVLVNRSLDFDSHYTSS